jgi:hypothetical protein
MRQGIGSGLSQTDSTSISASTISKEIPISRNIGSLLRKSGLAGQ